MGAVGCTYILSRLITPHTSDRGRREYLSLQLHTHLFNSFNCQRLWAACPFPFRASYPTRIDFFRLWLHIPHTFHTILRCYLVRHLAFSSLADLSISFQTFSTCRYSICQVRLNRPVSLLVLCNLVIVHLYRVGRGG